MNQSNLALVITCMLVGIFLRSTNRLPQNTAAALNAFVIWISLPALILKEIPSILEHTTWSHELFIPTSMAWLLFITSIGFFRLFKRFSHWSNSTVGALTLTAGLGNTSFVGFPLLESLHGNQILSTGVLCDQLGTFLALSTVGILYAVKHSESTSTANTTTAHGFLKNIISFPPFVAVLLATLFGKSGYSASPSLILILERLAATLVPIALVAVGFQLQLSNSNLRRHWRAVGIGLSFKLFAAPMLFTLLYRLILGSQNFATQITILESAMAPMITAGVVAEEFGFDREVVSLMIGIGVPLSLVTVPMWNIALTALGFTA